MRHFKSWLLVSSRTISKTPSCAENGGDSCWKREERGGGRKKGKGERQIKQRCRLVMLQLLHFIAFSFASNENRRDCSTFTLDPTLTSLVGLPCALHLPAPTLPVPIMCLQALLTSLTSGYWIDTVHGNDVCAQQSPHACAPDKQPAMRKFFSALHSCALEVLY